jgi:hypothetical protein
VRPLNLAVVAMLGTGATRGLADSTSHDLEKVRGELSVLTDDHGHYLAYARAKDPTRTTWFYGDGKAWTHIPVGGASRQNPDRARVEFSFKDPRYETSPTHVLADLDINEFEVACGKRITAFRPAPAEVAKVAAKVTLREPPPGRLIVFFARGSDDTTYYYVDKGEFGPNDAATHDYRVFVGKRGAVRELAVKDYAGDSAGLVIVTGAGRLRWIKDKDTLDWIATGAKPIALTQVRVSYQDREFIYNELGVFSGKRFGTPCDDL